MACGPGAQPPCPLQVAHGDGRGRWPGQGARPGAHSCGQLPDTEHFQLAPGHGFCRTPYLPHTGVLNYTGRNQPDSCSELS